MILTKNSLTQLDVFFWKNSFQNIHRPNLSYLKLDSFSEVKQAFHIGFEESMGFLKSYTSHVGVMVFEVLEGYPLQSLLLYNNEQKGIHEGFMYDLKDLEPMDFFCIQENGDDPYGDFILKNVKFYATKMEQGVNSPGRKLVAQFVCSGMFPFKLPYFYNSFISDNYNHHVVRSKKEIEDICLDIVSLNGVYSNDNDLNTELSLSFRRALRVDTSNEEDLDTLLHNKWKSFISSYSRNNNNVFYQYQEIKDILEFIKVFYSWKNQYELKRIKSSTRMNELLKYFDKSSLEVNPE
ncbi:MAG: hypothetical protein ACRCX2_19800 [Paraclostridium sp.]